MRAKGRGAVRKSGDLQGLLQRPHRSPQVWILVVVSSVNSLRMHVSRLFPLAACNTSPVDNCARRPVVYTGRSAPRGRLSLPETWIREADLPAQRAPSEAQARIPRADVHPGRPGDPEASAGARTQAPLRVSSSCGTRAPSLAVAGLRHGLPQGPLGLDSLPRPALVQPRGLRRRRAAPRHRRSQEARRRGRP